MALLEGQGGLRAETIDRVVKGFALQSYVFKQLLMVGATGSWRDTYFREDSTDLANGTNTDFKIPRNARFPKVEPNWTEVTAVNAKYGGEAKIAYEDAITDNIDVIGRTLLRLARVVVKAVDDEIWDVITESQTPSLINSHAIASGFEWDAAVIANQRPLFDLLQARKLIGQKNYTIGNKGFLVLSENDFASIVGNEKVMNNSQFFTDDASRNGVVGRIVGIGQVLVSNSVTEDFALLGIAKECGTWKSVVPLTVFSKLEPGMHWIIRAWEIGHTELVNPGALTLISNTQV